MATTDVSVHHEKQSTQQLALITDCPAPSITADERREFLKACLSTSELHLVTQPYDPESLLKEALRKLPAVGDFVLDLTGIETLSSSALAHCLRAAHQLEQRSNRLILKNASPEVQETLCMTRSDRRIAKAA